MRKIPVPLLLLAAATVHAQTFEKPADPVYYPSLRARLNAYVFRTYTDPQRLAWLLVDSAEDHWTHSPDLWDDSAKSYGYRVASGWGRRIVRNTTQFGFEAILGEDTRYRPCRCTEFRKRFYYAVSHSVLAWHADGSVGPAYGRIASGVVGAAASSTWHPQSIGAGTLVLGIGDAALDRAGNNLLTEFTPDLKTFGRAAWLWLKK